jgi:hypothetical protein
MRSCLDGAAKAAADKFQRGLGEQSTWGDELAMKSTSLFVGPNAGDVARGKKDIKKLWKKRLRANTREVAVGELAGATTPDGKLAWISAPVTRTTDDGAPLPLRVFAVYAQTGEDWNLVALQESLAIDEPGAGAAIVKTGAPPPAAKVEAKEQTAAADDDDTPKPKPKKKKPKKVVKKKPVATDDDDVANN